MTANIAICVHCIRPIQSSKDSTSPMSKTCKIRTGQVKFQDHKPDWACKIVKSKLKKYWTKQTRIPFFKSKQGQILLIRDKNGCHCRRRLWQINHIKISKPPMLWQKKSSGLCNFFRASKICLLPALWACDLKYFLRRLPI